MKQKEPPLRRAYRLYRPHGPYRLRPGPNTIHQYDPTMNIAKKTKASAN